MTNYRAIATWIWNNYDKLFQIGLFIISAGLPAWAASITPFMQEYAPFSWVGAGFSGLLISAIFLCSVAWAYSKLLIAKRIALIIEKTGVNPLEDRFDRKIIRLSDFYHPQYIIYKDKDFRQCELTGPGLVFFKGAHISGVEFRHVQIVISNAEKLWGVTAFEDPKFVGGTFSNLTMVLDQATYDALPDDMKRYIPVISRSLLSPS